MTAGDKNVTASWGGRTKTNASGNTSTLPVTPIEGTPWFMLSLRSVAEDLCRCQRGTVPDLEPCTPSGTTAPKGKPSCVLRLYGNGKRILSAQFGAERLAKLEEAADAEK